MAFFGPRRHSRHIVNLVFNPHTDQICAIPGNVPMPVSLSLRFTVASRSSNRSPSTSDSRYQVQSRPVARLQRTTAQPSTTPGAWPDRLIVHHPTEQQVLGSYRVSIPPRISSQTSSLQRQQLTPSRPPSYTSPPPSYTSSIQQSPTTSPPPPITADERPPKYEPRDPYGTR